MIEKTKEGVSYRGTPNHPKLDLIYIYNIETETPDFEIPSFWETPDCLLLLKDETCDKPLQNGSK